MSSSNPHRRQILKILGLMFIALSCQVSSLQAAVKPAKPNIILFLTDDQGWVDTSVQMMKDRADIKSDFYQTPNLERMAKEGLVFSNAYAPAPQCSPSRGSIQFGKTPARLKQTKNAPPPKGSMRENELSIARMIKSSNPGYATAHFGKWHVAHVEPEQAGYDESDGHTGNLHGDWLVVKKTLLSADDPKRIFSITERSINFMEKQVEANKPFYMQVSHYACHTKHHALKETIEKYENIKSMNPNRTRKSAKDSPEYAGMVENLDTSLGAVLDKVKELGIKDNTYIIFTSDNGGILNNVPLKGVKRDLWEGGLRVPTVVCGPNVLKDSYCDVPVIGWDFLPTFSDLIGNQQPLPEDIDGGSLKDLFEKGNKGKVKRPTQELMFQCFLWGGSQVPAAAIRDGDYKLVENLVTNEISLYNLSADIGEKKNLAKKMPEKTARLHKKLLDYLKQVDAQEVKDIYPEGEPAGKIKGKKT